MESADLGQHTSKRFNEDMERVRTRVLEMGGFVEQQLQRAVKALIEGDSNLGEEVARDDYRVNQMEVEIDEECGRIIATRAPTASDLRVMVAIIKTITDLERIGDEVEKVGHIAARLATMEKPSDNYREIRHLGRLVTEMVHDALHSNRRDVAALRSELPPAPYQVASWCLFQHAHTFVSARSFEGYSLSSRSHRH